MEIVVEHSGGDGGLRFLCITSDWVAGMAFGVFLGLFPVGALYGDLGVSKMVQEPSLRNVGSTVAAYIHSGGNRFKIAAAFAIDLLTTTINVVSPYLMVRYAKEKLDREHEIANPESTKEIAIVVAAGVGLLVAQVLPRVRNLMLDSVRANVQSMLTKSMVNQAYKLPLDAHLTSRTGHFAQALSKNYSSVDKGIPSFYGELVPFGMEQVGVAALLTAEFGPIGLVPAGIVAVFSGIAVYGEAKAFPIRNECVRQSYQGYGAVMEAINNYYIAKIFGNQSYELERVGGALDKSEQLYRKMHHQDDYNGMRLSLANSLLCGLGGFLFVVYPPTGAVRIVDLGLFLYFLTRLNSKLETIPAAVSALHTALADGSKIVSYLQKQSDVNDAQLVRHFDTTYPLRIEFRNVCFRYENKLILDDFSFVVEPGQKFAIVGATGSGKTTILKLLLRLYKPTSGEILLNGVNIEEVTADSIRHYFAVVSQDSILFSGTIADNIRYGRLDASDEEVVLAARQAKLIDEEEAAGGVVQGSKLARPVGQGGGMLSGGEKQRVIIARAILSGGKACLLDEPATALDARTESAALDMLDQLSQGVTTVVISHRLYTLGDSNQILYLKDGKIAEQGSYQELVEKRGLFREQLEVLCADLGIDISQISQGSSRNQTTDVSLGGSVFGFWKPKQWEETANRGATQKKSKHAFFRVSVDDARSRAPTSSGSGLETRLLEPKQQQDTSDSVGSSDGRKRFGK